MNYYYYYYYYEAGLPCLGHLSAELRNANGSVPVDVVRRDRDRCAVSFVPLVEGTSLCVTLLTMSFTNNVYTSVGEVQLALLFQTLKRGEPGGSAPPPPAPI